MPTGWHTVTPRLFVDEPRRLSRVSRLLVALTAATAVSGVIAQTPQQVVDPDFTAGVESAAYGANGPVIAIDEAHGNLHTAGGQYQPFTELLTRDGYRVRSATGVFAPGAFEGIDVLVVANASAHNLTDAAFTDPECDALRDWVREGGALLLIADHEPFGTSAATLARRFGVTMGTGRAFEPTATSITTQFTFSRDNNRLGTHPILRGRGPSEEVRTVRTFTGQSLIAPDGATPLLLLSPNAREAATTAELDKEGAARMGLANAGTYGSYSYAVGGRNQGLAMPFGRGRLVVLGEAALFSAQLIRFADGRETRIGMNVPGNDDRQFALNVLHWLSGLLN
jgi:hypothetical protein